MTPLTWLVMGAHVPSGGAGGGMVRYVVELVRAMRRRTDLQLHVVASHAAASWWREDMGIQHVHAVPSGPVTVSGVRDLLGLGMPSQPRFDVVHGTKHMLPMPRRAQLRVLTVHDMLPLDRPGDFRRSKRLLLRHPYLTSIRRADLLLCVSEATRRRMASYLPEVVNRARVVQLGPADALLAARPHAVPGLLPGHFVLAVGDNSPRKNLRTLLAGWARVRGRFPAAKLVLVGPPGWGVEGESGSGHVDDRVVRMGHLPDRQLRWCYENAAAVAMPSVLEGFGLPAAEARAFGTPLIISEDSALVEVAQGHGLIADSADPATWAKALAKVLAATCGAEESAPDGEAGEWPDRDWDAIAAETVAAARDRLPVTRAGAP